MHKIETERHENCLLTMTVEVDAGLVDRTRRAVARRLSRRANIPGFRRGKAPYPVVLRQFGADTIYRGALEELTQQVFQESLEQAGVDAIRPGTIENEEYDPMVLTFSVPLRPVVDLGDYRAIRHERQPGVVDEEEFEQQLEQLREQQAVIDPVDRPARIGDMVVVNVAGHLSTGGDDAGSEFLLNDRNVSLIVIEDLDWPAPGFADHLVGMAAGDVKSLDYVFPDDYPNEALRGKQAYFTIEMMEVKYRILPEWSDSLAQSIGDFESLLDLRLQLHEQMQRQADMEAEVAYRQEVVSKLIAGTQVEYPQVLLDEELKQLLDDMDRRLREQGLTLADYCKVENKSIDQIEAELEPQAQERLVRSLVLSKVARVEKLRVDEADLDEHIEAMTLQYSGKDNVKEFLSTDEARQTVAMDLLSERVIKRLVAIAQGEDPPIS